MRFAACLTFALALAGCDGPSAEFAGLPPRIVEVEGSTFRVWVDGPRAEALRTNAEASFTLAAVAPRAARAMEMASGCRVVPGSIEGDAAMIRAALDCG